MINNQKINIFVVTITRLMPRKSSPEYDAITCSMLEKMLVIDEIKASNLRDIASWRAIDSRLCSMMDDGLLTRHVPDKGRKVLLYELTAKGRSCAKLIHLYHGIYAGCLDMEDGVFAENVDEFVR